MKSSADTAFADLAHEEDAPTYNMGVVRLLAQVQETAGPARVPHLAAWCAEMLKPRVDKFRNRTRREQMATVLQDLAAKGNLTALLHLVDNPARLAADEEGFRRAKAEFASLVEQMNWLRNGGLTKPAVVRGSAREASSIVSGVIAAVAVLLITLTSVF